MTDDTQQPVLRQGAGRPGLMAIAPEPPVRGFVMYVRAIDQGDEVLKLFGSILRIAIEI